MTQEELDIINERQTKIWNLQNRLNSLSDDFIQIYLGAEIPNINERRKEFVELHNELRSLLGKEPRNYKLEQNEENSENE